MDLFTVRFNNEDCKYEVVSKITGIVFTSRGNYLDALIYIKNFESRKHFENISGGDLI